MSTRQPDAQLDITIRGYDEAAFATLCASGLTPVEARIYAARGISDICQLDTGLARLLPYSTLKNIAAAAALLADAIADKKRLLIVADYDADGATACAVGIRALRAFGANVDFLVPNRFEHGYGLTPEIVRLATNLTPRPDLLITVDNGIASVEGVAEANRLGMQVLVTDHHLPGDSLPDAACIVNPNQVGCDFPSKNLAGVGVMFYVMLALRGIRRQRTEDRGQNLARLLDLVALGTVADVVKLDDNNRILVEQGLRRIRAGRACCGINALLQVAKREARKAATYDLGFMLGPRLNAAGRLENMALGIECLITDDPVRARQIAAQLDTLNRERRGIEAGMQESALDMLKAATATLLPSPSSLHASPFSLCLFNEAWHQGVIGILASRIKDKFHRPVIAFANALGEEIKGSGRSIVGLHLRDALDLVSKKHPDLILKFGGHAAAAGLTLHRSRFEEFRAAFEDVVRGLLTPADLQRVIKTDGTLPATEMTLEMAQIIAAQAWGQGFPEPTFSGRFRVETQRVVGEKHLKLKLKKKDPGAEESFYDGILFFHSEPLPEIIDAVYRLEANEFNGKISLQLNLTHWSAPKD